MEKGPGEERHAVYLGGHACDLVCSLSHPILFTRGKTEGHRGQVTLLVRGGAGQPDPQLSSQTPAQAWTDCQHPRPAP